MSATTPSEALSALTDSEFMLLTTYRADGTPVPTTVWLTEEDGRIYVRTMSEAGKIKRVRRTPRVTMAPCGRMGEHPGAPVEGTARVLSASETERGLARFDAKYGPMSQEFTRMQREGGKTSAIIEIVPVP